MISDFKNKQKKKPTKRMEFAVLPSRNSLMQMYRLLYICTDHTTSKETGIVLLEKTLVITLSAVVFLRTAVLGWDFLVLLFFFTLFTYFENKRLVSSQLIQLVALAELISYQTVKLLSRV